MSGAEVPNFSTQGQMIGKVKGRKKDAKSSSTPQDAVNAPSQPSKDQAVKSKQKSRKAAQAKGSTESKGKAASPKTTGGVKRLRRLTTQALQPEEPLVWVLGGRH